jgi:hypothetical protein
MGELNSNTEQKNCGSEGEAEEGKGNHYNDESVATHYESAFCYDNVEDREW